MPSGAQNHNYILNLPLFTIHWIGVCSDISPIHNPFYRGLIDICQQIDALRENENVSRWASSDSKITEPWIAIQFFGLNRESSTNCDSIHMYSYIHILNRDSFVNRFIYFKKKRIDSIFSLCFSRKLSKRFDSRLIESELLHALVSCDSNFPTLCVEVLYSVMRNMHACIFKGFFKWIQEDNF